MELSEADITSMPRVLATCTTSNWPAHPNASPGSTWARSPTSLSAGSTESDASDPFWRHNSSRPPHCRALASSLRAQSTSWWGPLVDIWAARSGQTFPFRLL